jgi:hypothetical protein
MFACINLDYWQQTQLTQQTTQELGEQTVSLRSLAPQVEKLSKQADALQQTIDQAVVLGHQRNAWPAVLDALNDKIPEGVWITQLTPAFDPTAPAAPGERPRSRAEILSSSSTASRGSQSLGGYMVPTDTINVLVVNGLYHTSDKTPPVVDPDSLREFVQALSGEPSFDIDPQKATDQVKYTSSSADPDSFAEPFSMHLKLKQPIVLTP